MERGKVEWSRNVTVLGDVGRRFTCCLFHHRRHRRSLNQTTRGSSSVLGFKHQHHRCFVPHVILWCVVYLWANVKRNSEREGGVDCNPIHVITNKLERNRCWRFDKGRADALQRWIRSDHQEEITDRFSLNSLDTETLCWTSFYRRRGAGLDMGICNFIFVALMRRSGLRWSTGRLAFISWNCHPSTRDCNE